MIAALVNLTPGVGRTTLAVNLAGELALQGRRVVLLDTDGASGALEWATTRRRNGEPALFDTVAIASPQLRHGLQCLDSAFEHVVIDTPARSPAAVRAALLAADTALVPTAPDRPSLGCCAATLELVIRAQVAEPAMGATVVLTRAPTGLVVEPGDALCLLGLRLPVSAAVVRQRLAFATSRSTGLLVAELDTAGRAEADVRRVAVEVFGSGPVPVGG
ncbi:nucleotide-binding protein [Azospirillum sp. ST 5-10]|uniref:nucleotide-binding protein n=1 Tax=unclassified Azospirillum TaxID=2630922 RepID=UPI003F49E7D4